MSRILHGPLTANTPVTVTLVAPTFSQVEIINVTGTSAIYFTLDGSTPTVAGADCEVLPAAIGSVILPIDYDEVNGQAIVKLISAGSPGYCVAAR